MKDITATDCAVYILDELRGMSFDALVLVVVVIIVFRTRPPSTL